MTTSRTTRADIAVVDDPAREVADHLAHAIRRGGNVALAGGGTPRAAYELLARMPLDWSRTTVWLSDERCVQPHDPHSNFRMLREALLDRLPPPTPAIQRIAAEQGPGPGADDYERRLRAQFHPRRATFDLVLLGLGPDGHCASLFPRQEPLTVRDRLAVGIARAGLEPFVPRVSLTLPALNAARRILFMVTGPDKANAVRRAFTDPPSANVPASLVDPPNGSLRAVLDPPAAAMLP